MLCAAADAYGSGLIDLTSRGNLQVRGVTERTYIRLLGELQAADLVDENLAIEARNNVLVSPLWQVGDDSAHIAGRQRDD